jgi:hypothetical protein
VSGFSRTLPASKITFLEPRPDAGLFLFGPLGTYRTALGVLGSVRPTVKSLLNRVKPKSDREFFDHVTAQRKAWDEMLDKQCIPRAARIVFIRTLPFPSCLMSDLDRVIRAMEEGPRSLPQWLTHRSRYRSRPQRIADVGLDILRTVVSGSHWNDGLTVFHTVQHITDTRRQVL